MADANANKTTPSIKRACSNCREQKVRCDVIAEPLAPCSRCRRLRLDCVLAPLKRRFRGAARIEDPLQPLRLAVAPKLIPRNFKTVGQGEASPSNAQTPYSTRVVVDQKSQNTLNGELNSSGREIDGFVLDDDTILDLHAIYFKEYAMALPILDSDWGPDKYYTVCPLLFWSVMVVASRRYRKDPTILSSLSRRVMKIATESVGGPTANVHIVESLLILLTWWFPHTPSVNELPSVISGSLIHLAMFLGLHRPLRSQDYYRTKLYLTNQDLIRRSELWTQTVLLYQRLCIISGNFFCNRLDVNTSPQQANSLFQCFSPELRYYSQLQNNLTRYLVALADESQRVDDGAASTSIASLILLADAHLSEHRPESGPDALISAFKQLHHLIARLAIYSHHLHDIITSPSSTTLTLYNIACSLTSSLEKLRQIDPYILSHTTTYICQALSMAAFTIMKLLRMPSFSQSINIADGRSSLFFAINFTSELSLQDQDFPSKLAKILSQLWSSEKAFRNAKGEMNLELRIRSRGALSIVYDGVWWWREEFGGQPKAFEEDATTTTWSGTVASTTSGVTQNQPYPEANDSQLQGTQMLDTNTSPSRQDQHPEASFSKPQQEGQPYLSPSSTTPWSDPTSSFLPPTDPAMTFGDQMLADMGWDAFDDFLFMDPTQMATMMPEQGPSAGEGGNGIGRVSAM